MRRGSRPPRTPSQEKAWARTVRAKICPWLSDAKALAVKYGAPDDDMIDDLRQIGVITVLTLDLHKPRTNKRSYVNQAMKFRMFDYLRKHRPYRIIRTQVTSVHGHKEFVEERILATESLEALERVDWVLTVPSDGGVPAMIHYPTTWDDYEGIKDEYGAYEG